VRKAAYHLHVLIVLKSGSLNLLEHSGSVQVCNRIALPFLLEDLCTFMITSRSESLGTRNISEVLGKNQTHILRSVTFFENRAVYETMWKNIVEPGRPRIRIWRIRIYVIRIIFPLQQLFHERASMLRCTYIVYVVYCRTR